MVGDGPRIPPSPLGWRDTKPEPGVGCVIWAWTEVAMEGGTIRPHRSSSATSLRIVSITVSSFAASLGQSVGVSMERGEHRRTEMRKIPHVPRSSTSGGLIPLQRSAAVTWIPPYSNSKCRPRESPTAPLCPFSAPFAPFWSKRGHCAHEVPEPLPSPWHWVHTPQAHTPAGLWAVSPSSAPHPSAHCSQGQRWGAKGGIGARQGEEGGRNLWPTASRHRNLACL